MSDIIFKYDFGVKVASVYLFWDYGISKYIFLYILKRYFINSGILF